MTEWSRFISKANHSASTVIQAYAPTTDAEELKVDWLSKDLSHLLKLTSKKKKKDALSQIVDWNAKNGSLDFLD